MQLQMQHITNNANNDTKMFDMERTNSIITTSKIYVVFTTNPLNNITKK
jgi:hypothetical protein